ncbi:MAG: DoxX family protein [Alphaproteobacteria bacterium]|nr:DoxX family protein [Alphaproteobacteria bacterium]MBU0805894.1 DoxX family protein [Alphaproteobacteria bacterium]MBU0874137.1 DoxX family protein [Alphaproteobacteria bacterium]MBU1402039.1 DoxX family protein [Alphaproteobacteria bacterium]MBU1590684.1 DoxX family protein [Alphaproteobacteria bacterium]
MSITTTATSSSPSTVNAAVLIGRIFLAVMFVLAGYSKLTAIGATAGWFESLGLPMPSVVTVVAGMVELVGGLAIIAGFQTRIAALVIAAFTVGATLIAHMDFADQTQQLFFMKNLAVTGGLLVLAAFGAGAYSLDARRG